mgnify:FL=1
MNALAIPFDLSPHKPYFGWKKKFGFFSRDLVIFGFFWIFKFQLEIPFSDCMGSTRYSFRPFWANKRGEKNFFSYFLPFLLNKKKFFKIRSFEFWIKNYAPKFIRWLLEVDLEASFVIKIKDRRASGFGNLTDRSFFSIYSRAKAYLQACGLQVSFRARIYTTIFVGGWWRASAVADIGGGNAYKVTPTPPILLVNGCNSWISSIIDWFLG